MTKKQKKVGYRLLASLVLLVAASLVPAQGIWALLLYLIPYLIIGYDILRKAFLGICHGEVFDENFLMAVATVGAMCLGEYREGCAVMLFYQIGELFQSVAVGKSRRNISALLDIRPDYASVERDGVLVKVDPEEVEVGTVITVIPGERIPLDGVILEGSSSLDTAALTGESMPRDVREQDEVYSGSINLTGVLKIRTLKAYEESTVSRILELVENSAMKKSKTEHFITRFAKYYTPAVCYSALALAVLPPLYCLLAGWEPAWSNWLIRALTFLVISCPCALVISIPLSFFGGIGGASACGILVKGANDLETLASARYVVFDKTGTLTEGKFQVTGVFPAAEGEGAKEELLRTAAFAEAYSSHPISQCLKEAWGQEIPTEAVTKTRELSGYGVIARIDGREVAAGNQGLMERLEVEFTPVSQPGTVVYVAAQKEYLGCLVIEDTVKKDAAKALEQLRRLGIRQTVMLTGDREESARKIGAELGIDQIKSQLLPGDKVQALEEVLACKARREACVFVGDGINDAPVLTRADVGIAMGALGADAAIEAADVVLMDDQPVRVPQAIGLARRCMGIVYQNIVFALGVKAVCLLLGAFGYADMWLAIFADVGVMVLAVLNAMRCLRTQAVLKKMP